MKASTPARRTIRRSSPRSRPPAPTSLWGGLHTEGGLILRQMRDQGLKTVIMSGDGIAATSSRPSAAPASTAR